MFDPEVNSCLVTGDAHRVEQVVVNLLTNAVRYAPDSNQIKVMLIQQTGEVKIGVEDFGIGIPHDKLQNIFSRYYRVHNSTGKGSGLGIGLYLCQEIVTRHHGKIWAESTPGKGSTFWFTLPCS
ncbi:Adaptive-response sensory-kinase SasA [compost metagenome]